MTDRTWNLDCMVKGSFTLQQLLDGRVSLVNYLGMDMDAMAPDVRERALYQPTTTGSILFDMKEKHVIVTIKSHAYFDCQAVCSEIARVFGPILDMDHHTLGQVTRDKIHKGDLTIGNSTISH